MASAVAVGLGNCRGGKGGRMPPPALGRDKRWDFAGAGCPRRPSFNKRTVMLLLLRSTSQPRYPQRAVAEDESVESEERHTNCGAQDNATKTVAAAC